MKKRGTLRALGLLGGALLFAAHAPLHAAEFKGNVDMGFWHLRNNVSSQANFQADDLYGNNYIQDQYSLFSLGLRTKISKLFGENASQDGTFHFKGRSYFNIGEKNSTFSFSNAGRHQLYEASLELPSIAKSLDLWVGRQRMYEAGGARVDGLRLVYHSSNRVSLGLFGGFANDLRNQVGYLGSAYRSEPFSLDYLTSGVYASYRGNAFRGDVALHAQWFKKSLDRMTAFAQGTYDFNARWSLSGLVEADVAGVAAFRLGQLSVITRPQPSFTNTLSLNLWRVLQFDASNLSTILPSSDPLFNSTLLGGAQVTDAYYYGVRDQIMFRIFDRNYVFGAIQYMKRTFDDQNQIKYTVGYRDPQLFDSDFDLRIQADLIDNYRGFNTGIDLLMGRNFRDGEFRLEMGGTLEGNERDAWQDLSPTSAPRTTEKEWSLRAHAFYYPIRNLSCALQYAFRQETETNDLDAKIQLHEIFLTTSLRF